MSVDQVRWFDALGTCKCGKPATGVLRGPRNESYGPSCLKCAKARLAKAEKERLLEEKRQRVWKEVPPWF
jgi:hypothetical protein